MNCTYKTNRYCLPLLEIFGVTSTELKFSIAFVYLQSELESAHAKLKKQLSLSQGDFEQSWNKIHALLEFKLTAINASFEKSLNVVQCHFKPVIFKELRGFIAMSVMNIIFEESNRPDYIEYKYESRPVPFSCIDPHWKNLDLLVPPKDMASSVSCTTEVNMFVHKFNENDTIGRLHLLRKMKELLNPACTSLSELVVKMTLQGRSKVELDISTHRDLSGFEYVESGQSS
ncbi:hypothetical protein FEM48_Zijuj09G0053000 [Ziziphus jujuba var. spinosa]|uniref:Uncharacterized protein n=1 Tax=Ziziphus jujuba var. spinosa TaxID=714518 RepID=A0A978UR39_ZIZJJ|nr:hypothetical protein FEM48_Zijuj09G0053000 [Ziziphus jujuba var. spinosa]